MFDGRFSPEKAQWMRGPLGQKGGRAMKVRLTFRLIVLIRTIIASGEYRTILKHLYQGNQVLVIDEKTGEHWYEDV